MDYDVVREKTHKSWHPSALSVTPWRYIILSSMADNSIEGLNAMRMKANF